MNSTKIGSSEIQRDQSEIEEIMQRGPDAPVSEARPEVPPMPSQKPQVESQEAKPAVKSGEGPDSEMVKDFIRPSEAEAAKLKQHYGPDLKVVPMPYSGPNGKTQCFVLRPLMKSQWDAMEAASMKLAEQKPVPFESIMQDKVVAAALVWPNVPEHEFASQKPGLIPTLFGVIQQQNYFFDPSAIMQLTFNL